MQYHGCIWMIASLEWQGVMGSDVWMIHSAIVSSKNNMGRGSQTCGNSLTDVGEYAAHTMDQ